jgi:hypothetical protein
MILLREIATDVGLQLTAFGGRGKAPFNRAIMQSGSAIGVPVCKLSLVTGAEGSFQKDVSRGLTFYMNCSLREQELCRF